MRKLAVLYILVLMVLVGCRPGKETSGDGAAGPKAISGPDKSAFTYVFLNATKEKMLGNYEAAGILFRESIKLNPADPAPYYELAHMYYFMGRKDEALGLAKKAVDLNPSNTWYHILYVGLLQESENFPEAARELEMLKKLEPAKLEYSFDLAETHIRNEKFEEALKEYEYIEQQVGITEQVSRQKQKLYLALNNVEKAAAEAEKLSAAFPGDSRYLAMLADIYRSNDQQEKAFRIYNRILENDSLNPFALLSLADHYKEKGESGKSLGYLEKAFGNPNLDIDTKVKILLSYYVMSEEDTALRNEAYGLAEILLATHPGEAKSYAVYGDFLVRDSRFAEARDKFRKAVELDPSRLPIWSQLLLLESELGDQQALYDESTRAAEMFPANPSMYFFRGVAASRLKKHEEAVEALEMAAALVVDDPQLSTQIYSGLGDAYHALGNHEKSDRAYEIALKLDPNNVFVLNNYSYYLSLRGTDLEKAAEMAKRANEKDPGNASFQDTYGWILYGQGKFNEALQWLKKAMDSDGGNSTVILEHYGDALFQTGQHEEAIRFWKRALEQGPGNPSLIDKIKRGTLP